MVWQRNVWYNMKEVVKDMSRKFILEKDYYEQGVNLYKRKTVTINSGVTVLVGCNGMGKATFLRQIRDRLKKQDIPCIQYRRW